MELIFTASALALVGSFANAQVINPDMFTMLFSIFAVAAVEVITLVTFYVYMKHKGMDFDIRNLSKLKW